MIAPFGQRNSGGPIDCYYRRMGFLRKLTPKGRKAMPPPQTLDPAA